MADSVEVVEGWTGRLDFQLQMCSTSVNLGATDIVSAWLYDRTLTVVTTSTGTITEVTASCGHVAFSVCTSCQFKATLSPYSLRFHIKDTNSKVVFFPNAEAILVKVRSV